MDNPVNSDLQTSFQISAKISVVEGNMRRREGGRVGEGSYAVPHPSDSAAWDLSYGILIELRC